jgi:hypothetical protein
MNPYRERLLPPLTVFLASALLVPATLLVFLPIDPVVGVVVAVLFYAAAGRARLHPDEIGEVTGFTGSAATTQRGPGLDARAWTLFRGWVGPVVKITLTDESDPAPYWLVSTRRPDEVVRRVEELRRRTPGR